MKVTVKIEGRAFEVEVGDVRERPIVATIEGARFEVWPAPTDAATDERRVTHQSPAGTETSGKTSPPSHEPSAAQARDGLKAVRAPIPGVIISVAVQPGARVAHGQELCILEAMKMKNAVRASRAGTIAAVRVAAGQHVRHHDVLMEYGD